MVTWVAGWQLWRGEVGFGLQLEHYRLQTGSKSVMWLASARAVRAVFPLERSRAKIGAQQKQLGSLELSK